MRNVNSVGVVTIARELHSLVRGKMMAEDNLGSFLTQHRSFFDNRISITRSEVFIKQSSVLQCLCRTLCGIGPKLIKATLE